VTLNAGMIMVCFMFNRTSNNGRINHDTQRFYKKIIDQFIAEYTGVKPYA